VLEFHSADVDGEFYHRKLFVPCGDPARRCRASVLGIPRNLEAHSDESLAMWAWAKSLKDAVMGLEKKAEESITDAQRALAGDTSQGDVDASDRQSREAGKEAADKASSAAKEEAERHAIHFKTPQWKDVVDKAEEVRDAAPKAFTFTKMLALKIAGGVVAAGLVVVSIFTGSQNGGGIREHVRETNQQFELSKMEMEVSMNQNEFNNLIRGLDVANLPSVPEQSQAAMPAQVAQAPAQVAMPLVVAAIAQTPVTATLTTATAQAQTVQTNIEHVYRTVPRAREPIERYAGEPHSGGFHGTINVTSPVGTAHFGW
jgi:hypothetical protein